jgi:hypothetical protein
MDVFEIHRLGGALRLLESTKKLTEFSVEIAQLSDPKQFRHPIHVLHIAARFISHGIDVDAPVSGADLLINKRVVIECKTRQESKPVDEKSIKDDLDTARKQTKRKFPNSPTVISIDWGLVEDYEPPHLPPSFKFPGTPMRLLSTPQESRKIFEKFLESSTRVHAISVSAFRHTQAEGGTPEVIHIAPHQLWDIIWKQGGKPISNPLHPKERQWLNTALRRL